MARQESRDESHTKLIQRKARFPRPSKTFSANFLHQNGQLDRERSQAAHSNRKEVKLVNLEWTKYKRTTRLLNQTSLKIPP